MKRTLYTLVTIDILFVVVFTFAFILPLVKNIRASVQLAVAQREEFARVQILKDEIRRFRVFTERYGDDIAAVRSSFIDPATPIDFVKFLERNASQGNVKLTVAPGVVKKESGNARPFLEFQISGTGPYPGVITMLKSTERAPFMVSLSSASIQRTEQGARFSATLKGLVR